MIFVLGCGASEAPDAGTTGDEVDPQTTSSATTQSPTSTSTTSSSPTTDTSSEGGDSSTGDPDDPPSAVPSIHPDDPHRLYRHGRTWVPSGYYPGAALNMTGEDFAGDFLGYDHALVDLLEEHEIDLFRVWINWGNVGNDTGPIEAQWDRYIEHPWLRVGPELAIDGEPRFDLDQPNPAYDALVDDAVAYAGERDIVVQVMLLDCWHAGFGLQYGFGELDYFHQQNNTNAVHFEGHEQWIATSGPVWDRHAAFVERVVGAIGHHPNIVWETCNEMQAANSADPIASASHPFHVAIADVIHATEDAHGHPRHLVVPVDLPEHRTVAGHRTPANGQGEEEPVEAFHRRLADEQFAWGLPLVSDNDCCGGEPDATLLRAKAWAALTGGGQVDVFNNELFASAVMNAQNTHDGMRWVGHVGRLLREREIDVAGMAPHDELVTEGAWCLARPGEDAIVYVPGGLAEVTIDALPPAYDAIWFDPREGTTQAAGSGPTFVAPTADDWVLHVHAE